MANRLVLFHHNISCQRIAYLFIYRQVVCHYYQSIHIHGQDGDIKPLSHQTALPQRLYSVLKPCQRAVGSQRNTPKNIKFVSYSVYTTSSQRPYSVHTTFPQRLYSVHDVFTARKQWLQRVHSAHTASSRRAHSVLTAIIAFKIFYLFFLFWVTLFCKHSNLFLLFKAIRHRI